MFYCLIDSSRLDTGFTGCLFVVAWSKLPVMLTRVPRRSPRAECREPGLFGDHQDHDDNRDKNEPGSVFSRRL